MLEAVVEIGLLEVAATRRVLDSLESAFVVKARTEGATWTELAELLGLTKQGVRARHLAVDPVFAARKLRGEPPTMAEYHAEIAALLAARARSAGESAVDG